jgi:iron-sulfur cluster insertion protein
MVNTKQASHAASLITLTQAAVATIQSRIASDPRPDLKLRVYIEGGGCSGLRYEYVLDPDQHEDDSLLWSNADATVCVISDELSAPYLVGATLDYVQDLRGAKFVVQNPQAEATCGCGSSFTLKE